MIKKLLMALIVLIIIVFTLTIWKIKPNETDMKNSILIDIKQWEYEYGGKMNTDSIKDQYIQRIWIGGGEDEIMIYNNVIDNTKFGNEE